jgi:hypothetical protein
VQKRKAGATAGLTQTTELPGLWVSVRVRSHFHPRTPLCAQSLSSSGEVGFTLGPAHLPGFLHQKLSTVPKQQSGKVHTG